MTTTTTTIQKKRRERSTQRDYGQEKRREPGKNITHPRNTYSRNNRNPPNKGRNNQYPWLRVEGQITK